MPQIKLSELAKKINESKIVNTQIPDELVVNKIATLSPGEKNSLSFLSHKKMLSEAKKTLSSVILTTEEFAKELSIPCIVVSNPELSLAEVLNLLYPPYVPAGTILAGGSSLRNSPKKKEIFVGWDYGLTFAEFQKVHVNIHNLVNFQKWAKRIKELEKHAGIKIEEKD